MGFDLASITAAGVGATLGSVGQLAKDVREAWTGEIPADKRAEFELKMIEVESALMNSQILVNLEEAKSDKIFVSGWRPFIGWVGGCGLAYASIGEPFFRFISATCFGYTGTFPIIDTTITLQVLIGILGLGAYRSYDKAQTPAPKGKE